MKTTLLILMALSACTFGQTLPPDAAALQAKRDAKVKEINQLYATALEKLMKKAMAEGNLETAKLLEDEMNKAAPDPFVTGDEAIAKRLHGTAWKHDKSPKVMTFRKDGRLDKSWGVLTPEWKVKNGVVSVEDSKMEISTSGATMSVEGGDKVGTWTILTSN